MRTCSRFGQRTHPPQAARRGGGPLERRAVRHPEADRKVVDAELLVVALELLDAGLRGTHDQVRGRALRRDVLLHSHVVRDPAGCIQQRRNDRTLPIKFAVFFPIVELAPPHLSLRDTGP